MLIITAICVAILIFPLFTTLYFTVKWREKTAFITITLFGFNLFKFNLAFIGNKIYIKKTFKRPYRIGLSSLSPLGAKMPKFLKFNVLSINILSNVSLDYNAFVQLTAISAVETLKNSVFNVIQAIKPYIKIKNDVNLYDKPFDLEVFLRVKAVFNAIDLIAFFIGKIMEKIHYAIGK